MHQQLVHFPPPRLCTVYLKTIFALFPPQKSIKKESPKGPEDPEKMVGQAPSNVEADPSSGSVTPAAASLLSQPSQSIPKVVGPVIPAVTLNSPIKIAKKLDIKEEPMHDAEMVYGTYDEATNCITIIYPEEDMTTRLSPLPHHQEQQQQQQQLLSPAHTYESMSPASMLSEDVEVGGSVPLSKLDGVLSDGGYESHGSPASSVNGTNSALADLWHESFSELFPSLA